MFSAGNEKLNPNFNNSLTQQRETKNGIPKSIHQYTKVVDGSKPYGVKYSQRYKDTQKTKGEVPSGTVKYFIEF